MIGFKHVPAEFADTFAQGNCYLVGTFGFYREMEGDRGDPLEGRVEHRLDGQLVVGPGPSPEDLDKIAALNKMGIELRGFQGNFTFTNCSHGATLREQYIFCCSAEPDDRYIAQGNAVFEISELAEFAECLRQSRPDLLKSSVIGPVQYEERTGDFFEGRIYEPDPFKKDIKFAAEKELRIVWNGAVGARQEKLQSFPAARLLKRVA